MYHNCQLCIVICRADLTRGVTIGHARRAVHAGPALWGGPKICPTLFFKVFWGEEGALLEYLHAGPLQPCYATVASGLAVDLAYLGSAFYMFLSIFSTFNLLVWDYFFMFLCSYFLVFIVGLVVRNSVAWDDVNF